MAQDASLKVKYRTKRGFTQTELLIALAVLGLIATFTIPKVMNHITEQHIKTSSKSIIASLQSVLYAATQDGSFTTVNDVIAKDFNYQHYCPPNNVTPPCDTAIWQATQPEIGRPRYITHDGATLTTGAGPGGGGVLISFENGTRGHLNLLFNPTNTTSLNTLPCQPLRPYQLGPSTTASFCTSTLVSYNNLFK
jgi:prepilin-type N-terminal cleavage/methylation domain-containing protein